MTALQLPSVHFASVVHICLCAFFCILHNMSASITCSACMPYVDVFNLFLLFVGLILSGVHHLWVVDLPKCSQ